MTTRNYFRFLHDNAALGESATRIANATGRNREEIRKHLEEIRKQMLHLQEKGGLNRAGKWLKDADYVYQDKYRVLRESVLFLEGACTEQRLALVIDRSPQYNKALVGSSTTEDLVKKNVSIKANKEINQRQSSPLGDFQGRNLDLNKPNTRMFVGESGRIYVDTDLVLEASLLYQDDKRGAEECVSLCNEIHKKLKQLSIDGGYVNDEWSKDPDHRYRHKFDVLLKALEYSLDLASYDDLALEVDRSVSYDEKWHGQGSVTRDLLDRAVALRGQQRPAGISQQQYDNAEKKNTIRVLEGFQIRSASEGGDITPHHYLYGNYNVVAGASGYLYVDGVLQDDLNARYDSKEKRQECANLFR